MPGPAAQPPPVASSLQSLERPEITRRVLANGLTLLVQRDAAHPLVAFHATARTGSSTEGPYLGTGISHVVEHMLFKGTARRPVGAVEKEARSYGGTSQGFTNYDTTSYQLVVNKESWSDAADLLIDALFFPTMDPAELLKEREVVLRELKMRADDPEQVSWDLLFANAYRVHPYRIPIIGHEPLLMKITAEDVRDYHETHYIPNSMVFSVVGDVDPEAVVRRIEELTAKIPPGKETAPSLPQEPLPLSPREIRQESEAQLGVVASGYPGVPLNHPDLYAMDLLSWVLGGGRGSVLDKKLKETGVVHAVSCWNYTPRERGLITVNLRADPERVPEAVRRLREELERFKEQPLPAEDLAAAKKAFLRDYLASRQTVGGLASDLASFEVLTGDPLFSIRYMEQVDRLRPEDLQRVAREYLRPERAVTVELFPRGALSPQAAAARSAGAGQSVARTEKIVLENGLRVLLRPDRRVPLVTLQVSMMGGVRYESDADNGISGVLSRMLTRGTRRRSADEITEAIKKMGAQVGPFSGRNSLGMGMEVVRSEASSAVRLLGEMVLEPSFPAEELEKQKKLALAGLKTQEEDPFSWGIRRLMSALFTLHPYRLDPAGQEGSISKLTPEGLARFHARALDPERVVLSVVGDFDREEMLGWLRDAFGKFRSEAAGAAPAVPAEPALTRLRERIESGPRQEGILLIGFPGLKIGDPRVPPMDLVEAVLSGGAGRLFSEVRERRGLAYTVGGFGVPGADPGAFVLYAMTDPANLEQVRRAMLEEIQKIGAAPVPEDELRDAKQGLLGHRRVARQSQGALAAQIAGDELYGLGFDYSDRYEREIQSATAEQVRQAARELLDPQRCVVVIGRPDETAAGREEPLQAAQPKR